MARTVTIAAVALFFLTTISFEQEGGNAAAIKLNALRQRAEHGDPQAQYDLGIDYELGVAGAPRDYTAALHWYKEAAARGVRAAGENVGRMYFEGSGVTKDYVEAARWFQCPKPSIAILDSCREIGYKDLPRGAIALLRTMKCNAGDSNYDYGSAVDLSRSGSPAYQVCCNESSHGPCGAVVIARVGAVWKNLTAKEGSLGFTGACSLFVPLENQHNGFHDVCLPNECSAFGSDGGKTCLPTVWQFIGGRYRSVPPASTQ